MTQFFGFLFRLLGLCLRVVVFALTFAVTFIALALGGKPVKLPKRRATRRRR